MKIKAMARDTVKEARPFFEEHRDACFRYESGGRRHEVVPGVDESH